jgi:hypothetical protein
MNREAYEKWACTINKVPTAWKGWQAASNKAIESLASWMLSRGFSTGHGDTIDDLLTELDGQIDDLQHAGQGEVPFDFAQPVLEPYYAGRILSVIAESTPQPEVDEVVFDMLKAAQGACKLGLKGYANTYIQNAIDLLSAGKED